MGENTEKGIQLYRPCENSTENYDWSFVSSIVTGSEIKSALLSIVKVESTN